MPCSWKLWDSWTAHARKPPPSHGLFATALATGPLPRWLNAGIQHGPSSKSSATFSDQQICPYSSSEVYGYNTSKSQSIDPYSISLLFRYTFFCSPESNVSLDKVELEQGRVVAGLKTARDIEGGSYLLATCSSLSSDAVGTHLGSLSVVQPSPRQLGCQSPRLALGPFRFANHDCNPSAQASRRA